MSVADSATWRQAADLQQSDQAGGLPTIKNNGGRHLMKSDTSDPCKYFDLAQLVKKMADADGAIVIIIKGDDSRIAPDLPPEMMPYLPEILQSCAQQSASFLSNLAESLRPLMQDLHTKRN